MSNGEVTLRLGLTGSAGTGKTTLAHGLSDRLGLVLAPERMRDMLAAGFDFHSLTRAQHRDLLRRQTDELAAILARAGPGLVSDRTPLDFAAFWLSNGFGVEDAEGTHALLVRAVAAMADYSHVVLMPWGAIPLRADGVRSTNPWQQLHQQAILEGLLRRYVPADRLIVLPDCGLNQAACLDHVLARIAPPVRLSA